MKNRLKYSAVVFAAAAIMLLSVMLGSSSVSPDKIISVILNRLFSLPLSDGVSSSDAAIIWNIRLPRVILAFLVGGAVSVSGAVTQSVLKNPLASPFTLGISAGSAVGVITVIITGFAFFGGYTQPIAGFCAGMASIFIVLGFSRRVDKNMSNITVVLAGMVFSLFENAIITIMSAAAREKIERISLWQMGSFAMRGWNNIALFLPFYIIGIAGIMLFSKEMDILTFGDESSQMLGVEIKRVKSILFLLTSLLCGASVSICGIIGFIDLVAPHIARRLFGSRHCAVIPVSAVVGGCIALFADMLARTVIAPAELPVGAVTALVGAPFFCYVYFTKLKSNSTN